MQTLSPWYTGPHQAALIRMTDEAIDRSYENLWPYIDSLNTTVAYLEGQTTAMVDIVLEVQDQLNNIDKGDVGLSNVDNTADLDKPISTATQTALNGKISSSEKAAANGVASLGADAKIPTGQLPALAITDTFVVNTQAAMLTLSAQQGDVAVRTDLNKSFILTTEPATTLGNWQELLTPSSSVSSVFGRTGAITAELGDYSSFYAAASHVGAGGAEHAVATTSTAGFMSAADKTKLDAAIQGITAGSGIKSTESAGVVTLESGGATSVEITGASATLALTHANRFLKCNNATAQTITIPPQSSVAWPTDAQIEGAQWGAGAVTFVAGSGVTLRKRSNRTATTGGQYAAWGLKRISTNEWWLFGDLGSA